jgi:hypothetical protein
VPARAVRGRNEVIYVVEGEVEVELDGARHRAVAGDIARLPRGIPHGYFSVAETASRMLFVVTPAGQLKELFEALHDLDDLHEVYARSDGAGTVIGSWGEGPFEPGSRWPLDDRAVAGAQDRAGPAWSAGATIVVDGEAWGAVSAYPASPTGSWRPCRRSRT